MINIFLYKNYVIETFKSFNFEISESDTIKLKQHR